MMTDDSRKPKEDDALEEFFSASRGVGPKPDPALMDRILQDAAAVQAGFQVSPVRKPAPARPFARIADMLGGWGGVSALTLCAATGLIVGFSTPDTIASYSFGMVSAEASVDLEFEVYFGFDDFNAENG